MPRAERPSGRGDSSRALRHPGCFACGEDNPHGLRIHYRRDGSGAFTAVWRPTSGWEGFRGIVHGGIVSTVLDEAMSKAVAALCEALTAELRVRFRRRVESGSAMFVRGWVTRRHKRRIQAEATLTSAEGTEHAHAWAVFLAVGDEQPEPGAAAPR
ncbi:MAG: PaaI family thioesterase [Bryobacterales bacterium]|nr:PaaI family thioesterase [Bryobacterales bacterium]